MKPAVEYQLEGGGSILIEVDAEPLRGMAPAAPGVRTIERAQETFEAALARVKQTARVVVENLRDLATSPDEIQVEFGFKADLKGNLLIASAGGEATFKVALKWSTPKAD
ncbi:MAG TPA: CU044_2847 family protein [Phycisphaerae bacterium]|nr:CU044_2847 family protein [Phycisphaerae bacterium]